MASGIRSHDDQAWEGRTCGLLITGHEHFGNMDSGAVTDDNPVQQAVQEKASAGRESR